MGAAQIDFWFTMGSTYSFLSVMGLAELEQSTAIRFRWRPFHLLAILQEMKHVPFADKPTKLGYMWRDVERRAAMYRHARHVGAGFSLGRDRQRTHLSESLRDVGQDPARVLALANSEHTKMLLSAETDAARDLGMFGSPTFAVDRDVRRLPRSARPLVRSRRASQQSIARLS